MRLITGFVDTYLRLTGEEQKQFRETLVTIAPESEEVIMPLMTNSEELGWQRGLAEGRQEGAQQFTVRLLERQVGSLDEATRNHIAALPRTELEDLGLALSGFSSLADLQSWFDRQIAN
jgi:hypothetical protein